jgi:type VI protein secretion system component VasF
MARVLILGSSPLAALAWALPTAAQDAAEERSQAFQAVQGATKEHVAGGPLLVGAYGVIWALVLLYVIRLVRLQQQAQADVQRLRRALEAAPGDAPTSR